MTGHTHQIYVNISHVGLWTTQGHTVLSPHFLMVVVSVCAKSHHVALKTIDDYHEIMKYISDYGLYYVPSQPFDEEAERRGETEMTFLSPV